MAFKESIQKTAEVFSATILGGNDAQINEGLIEGVCTDSREVKPGMLFVARKGEDSDGHQYLEQAFASGASACVVANDWSETNQKDYPGVLLCVDSPTESFQTLAKNWRGRFQFPVIAITGSNGKTTTKEILKTVLHESVGKGSANIKSYNNHVGLPQTILDADLNQNWLVLEAGMSAKGELSQLTAIANPDIAIALNVGPAHLEFFETLADIADAKCEIFSHLRGDAKAIIGCDDAELVAAYQRSLPQTGEARKTVTFGLSAEAHFRATNISLVGEQGASFDVCSEEEVVSANLPLFGKHNVLNALAAVAAAKSAFPELKLEVICKALKLAIGPPMRLEPIRVSGVTILNDTYNANPVSMKSGVETAAELAGDGRFGLIIGDMLDIGPNHQKMHREIGELAGSLGAEIVIALGDNASNVIEGAKGSGVSEVVIASSATQAVDEFLSRGGGALDVVLVKASRDMKLERVVEELKERL